MKKNTKPNLCLDKINLTIFYLEKKYYFCPLHTSSCRAILIQVCSNFHSKTQPKPFRQPQCSPISQLPPDWTLESDPHCGKGTTPSRTVGSEPGSESLVHTAWGEKPHSFVLPGSQKCSVSLHIHHRRQPALQCFSRRNCKCSTFPPFFFTD